MNFGIAGGALKFDTVEAIDELPSHDSFELAPDDF